MVYKNQQPLESPQNCEPPMAPPPRSSGDQIRKIPFTLIHGGSIKAIAVAETHTIADLRKAIYGIFRCSAKYDLAHIDSNPETKLKTLNFPAFNKVTFHCKNEYCQAKISNQNLPSTSTSMDSENIQVNT